MKQAKKYLYSYPFSLKAMEGYLNQTILTKYRTNNSKFEFKDIYLAKDKPERWSLVAYDAHLTLAKAYLQEGLYWVLPNLTCKTNKYFVPQTKRSPNKSYARVDFCRSTCLILSGDSQNTWKKVYQLGDNLHHISPQDLQYSLEQTRYNGHLASHFESAKEYFRSLENEADNFSQQNILEIRNIIVKTIFRIMQGKNFE